MIKIFITGGAGYVGAVLTPYLLNKGYKITVLDLMIYGESVLKKIEDGKYKPLIDSIFPISEIVDAHIRIENRENIGKVVLDLS